MSHEADLFSAPPFSLGHTFGRPPNMRDARCLGIEAEWGMRLYDGLMEPPLIELPLLMEPLLGLVSCDGSVAAVWAYPIAGKRIAKTIV